MWMGSDQYRLAPALAELIHQLEAAFPAQAWQASPQTGTIGDAAHLAEGSASDHNPWIDNTVRALDVAANTPGGPDAEALFAMVNRMFAERDGRVWPNGYAIFNWRITDWDRPGEFHTQQGDPHLYHVHISVSQNPSGFNDTRPWPLPGEAADTGSAHPITPVQEDDVKPYFIKANSGRKGVWFMVPGIRLKEVSADSAAVLAQVHGIPNECTSSQPQGVLVSAANLINSWGN